MKKFNLNNATLQKQMLKESITRLIDANCSSDTSTCSIGDCKHSQECYKDKFSEDKLPNQRRPLKNILVRIRANGRKAIGKRSPHHSGNTLMERIEYCLGQNIYEHDLIKGCEWAKVAISRCTTLSQVVEILDRRHIHQYGKSKIWHYKIPS